MSFKDYILSLAERSENPLDLFKFRGNVKRSTSIEKARPDSNIDTYWDIYTTDPIVGACIDFTASFVLGAGMVVTLVDKEGNEVDVEDFEYVYRKSKPLSTMMEFLKDSLVTGSGYIEKVYSEDGERINRFQVLPSTYMRVHRDGHGTVDHYQQELGDEPTYEPQDIVMYKNRSIAGEAYGRSDIEPVVEVSEILRDMIIDLSNFVSTKAYPPILWKFGTEDKPWNPTDIRAFMLDREDVEPGDQIGVQGDISAEAVGVADKALDVEPYLNMFASMIVSGLRVPATLTSVVPGIGQYTAQAQNTAYTRRINEIRNGISELLEVELFDDMIDVNRYGDVRPKVTWKKHDDESLRLAVNNLIQLVQNSIISKEEARMSLSYPMEVVGTLPEAVDNPEGATPEIPAEADANTNAETGEDDGRTDQARANFNDEE